MVRMNQHPLIYIIICLLWFNCGWISMELIYGFTMVTHFVKFSIYLYEGK